MNKTVTFLQVCNFTSKRNNREYFVLEVLSYREHLRKYVLDSYFITKELYDKFCESGLETFEEFELIFDLNDNLKVFPSDYKKIY